MSTITDEAVLAYLTSEFYGDTAPQELSLDNWSVREITRTRRALAAALPFLLADQRAEADVQPQPVSAAAGEPVEVPDWGDLITDEPGPAELTEPADEYEAAQS
jgi:hypothetical protein